MTLRFTKIWRLLRELYADYHLRLFGLAGLGIFGGFLEGVGISLLIPLFTVFVKGGDLGSNFALAFISKALSFAGITLSFQTLLAVTFAAFLFKTATLFVSGYLRARITAQYKTEMRRRLYEAFLGADFSYLRRQKIGHLNHVVMSDVKQAARLFDDILGFILSAGSSLTFLAISLMLSWQITVLTAFLGAGLVLALLPLIRKIRRLTGELLTLSKQISHALAETLAGVKTVKALGVERPVAKSVRALFQRTEQAEFRKHCIKLTTKLSFEPVSVVFILVVFAVSYQYLSFDLVSFVAIIYLINRIFGNINNMQSGFSTTLEMLPAAEEFLAALREAKLHTPPVRGTQAFLFEREIAVTDAEFSYGGGTPALSGISFTVRKGESVGIIGPSGAGKTTLVDILLGLLTPSSGSITLDGVDVREISFAEWRRKVVYVAQEVFLRNDTISENIRFYDASVSDEDILDACRKTGIEGFIRSLPKGLATIVGERGTRLSGGERQRIALARALARKPAILILDEATSALDAESESVDKEMLARVRGALTVVIVAHRLSSVLDSDRIIALDGGRIVEEGSPQALQANPESYLSRMLALT
ncbi:MAG: ABC transporter ATP-binding protein, partial [bacterium]|nr:ABC transporter ATP-binding protein [bacterium]